MNKEEVKAIYRRVIPHLYEWLVDRIIAFRNPEEDIYVRHIGDKIIHFRQGDDILHLIKHMLDNNCYGIDITPYRITHVRVEKPEEVEKIIERGEAIWDLVLDIENLHETVRGRKYEAFKSEVVRLARILERFYEAPIDQIIAVPSTTGFHFWILNEITGVKVYPALEDKKGVEVGEMEGVEVIEYEGKNEHEISLEDVLKLFNVLNRRGGFKHLKVEDDVKWGWHRLFRSPWTLLPDFRIAVPMSVNYISYYKPEQTSASKLFEGNIDVIPPKFDGKCDKEWFKNWLKDLAEKDIKVVSIKEIRKKRKKRWKEGYVVKDFEKMQRIEKKTPLWVKIAERGVPLGMRDNTAIALTSFYVNILKLGPEETLKKLLEWNERNDPPIGEADGDPRDVERYFMSKIKSAQRGGYIFSYKHPVIQEILRLGKKISKK